MRHLRWAGLVFTLLIVGVLGGLMAPLPSEADPTLTIVVDGTSYDIPGPNAGGALSTTACPTGYNLCYLIPVGGTYSGTGTINGSSTGIARQWTIRSVSGGTATLLVQDTVGASSADIDKIKISGVEIAPLGVGTAPADWSATTGANGSTCPAEVVPPVPCTTLGEKHILKIISRVTMTANRAVTTPAAAPQVANYSFQMTIGGLLIGGPGATATPSGDSLTLQGVGDFCLVAACDPIVQQAALVNANNPAPPALPMSKLASTRSLPGSSSFTLQQSATLPAFVCYNGFGYCKPTITQTVEATLYGPDTLRMTSSHGACGGTFNLVTPSPGGPPTGGTQGRNLNALEHHCQNFVAALAKDDARDAKAAHASPTVPCNPQTETCPGFGRIVILKTMDDVAVPSVQSFGFTGANGIPATFTITTDSSGMTVGTQVQVFVVPAGAPSLLPTIKEVGFPTTSWFLNNLSCNSAIDTEAIGTDWNTYFDEDAPYGGKVEVTYMGDGDVLTCTFDNSDGSGGYGE